SVAGAVSGLSEVTSIAAGSNTSFAVLKDGSVMAWGNGSSGALGDGTTTNSSVPVPVCAVGTVGTCPSGPFLSGASAIATGGDHSLVLLGSGTVVDWGANGS